MENIVGNKKSSNEACYIGISYFGYLNNFFISQFSIVELEYSVERNF